MNGVERSPAQRAARRIALASWLALIALLVSWEWFLAPLRPGGSWLVLKAVPLLLPLRGLLRDDLASMQWALLLVLLYLAEGSVRFSDAPPVGALAAVEIAFGLSFFVSAIVYLRPFKLAARARKRT